MQGLCSRSIVAVALAGASAGLAHAQDPAARLQLMGAAFAEKPVAPKPGRTTASAFLPGRGVVTWDVTGMTPAQAREAEIEAMGLADARAVQREIDERNAAEAARAVEPRRAAPSTLALARDGSAQTRVRSDAQARGGADAKAFGVKSGESLKTHPRLYAFAAASGTGMGLNVTHDDGGWKNAGLTTDHGGFAGQKQAGLAWRLGRAQTALSYVQEKTRGALLGMASDKDHRVMLTTTLPTQSLARLFARKN